MEEKLNFSEVSALVVDGDRYSTSIVGQILRGFGVTCVATVDSGDDAKKYLATGKYDLLITECMLPDMKAAALVRWGRRQPSQSVRYIPIVMLTGYTILRNITAARDSGANTVVRKPVAPAVLFDHIAWSARTERPFIDADGYAGPCRRFKYGEPAPGFNRRAADQYPDLTSDRTSANEEGVAG